jgi:O-antigen ligase/polysaccharide polymerase Wzy-like membrane protein
MRSGWLKAVTILARAVQPAARLRALDRLIPLLVGAVVLGFAAGSSSVPDVMRFGHPVRWVLLAVLLVASALWAHPLVWLPGAAIAAAGLVCLAALSTAWSVEPKTTFERAVSVGILLATSVLLAAATRGQPDRASGVVAGVVGGAAAVGIAGIVLLVVSHHRAVQSATYEAPTRFNGFGQDPNTVALLFAVVFPLAVWAVVSTRRRVLASTALLLFAGTIVASGSRGALFSAAAGTVVVLAALMRRPRRTIAAATAVVALTAAGAWIQSLPQPSSTSAGSPASAVSAPKPRDGYLDAEAGYPLNADVGRPLPGGGQPAVRRSFFGASGRIEAWAGALHEAARRPVVGHGFGTEQAVFVDRYYSFVGGLPENSYLGMALQLGLAGLLALAVLVVALAMPGLRALSGPRRDLAAAGLGVLAAGMAIAVVQSYLYSAGNIAAAALWIPSFVLSAGAADA